MKKRIKKSLMSVAHALAGISLLPGYALYRAKIVQFVTISQTLSLVPSIIGVIIRRVWYKMTLKRCGKNLYVDFLATIRTPKTRIGNNCYIGVANWIGSADIRDDFISGSHVVVLSGKGQHSFDRTEIPIRLQKGKPKKVKIGADVWVGARAVIMADVARGTVIGAGSVVNKTFPEYSIIAGVPAKIIRRRGAA